MARRKQEKPPRRKPGTGAIRYKKGRTLPYEAAFPLGHGQYRYDYFLSASEATAHLDRLTEEAHDKKHPRNVAGGTQGVGPFLHAWLLIKSETVREKTLSGYQYLCELAAGWFGPKRRLDEIHEEDAAALLRYFAARDFKNVAALRAVLQQAFKFAMKRKYIAENPFADVTVPHVEHRQAIALTRKQRTHMLQCAVGQDVDRIPLCVLWHLYSRLGLRRGEGLGLLWANVNWKEQTITITQQYTAIGGRLVRSEPKTRRSRRTIPLPPDLFELLQAHYAAQRKRAANNTKWVEHGLVFAGRQGGPISPRPLTERWDKLKAAAGVPDEVTIHDLRHTAGYLLDQDRVPQSVQMALLGHTTTAMNRHYTDHADLEAMRAAIVKTG